MTKHALNRLNERYGNKYSMYDIAILLKLIKKGQYLEIVKDFIDRDRIKILLRYNNIPIKLVYSKKTNSIVTALPIDVDEFNEYSDKVPSINVNENDKKQVESNNTAVQKIRTKFFATNLEKKLNENMNLETELKNGTTIYSKKFHNGFVILWLKKETDLIYYQICTKKSLHKRLWHFILQGFKEENIALLKNATLLYAKIYK